MRKVLGLAFLVALVATPALAQKVTIDYSREFDFESVKTFQYVTFEESKVANPLMAERIVNLVKQKLTAGGLQEVSENPDIYVTCHGTTAERTSYNTTSFGYGGYWGGWYGWGRPMMGSSTISEVNYTEGTLIFDAYDAAEKKLVWRGTGTVTIKDQPEKQIKQVESILKKLGDKWRKILKGQGK
ncbi:MAG: DUF4136 domain-containing protein [Thermoanaerobaculales bacterium]|jgi:hypothetical protein|nr:DUF4136 domain-containing protein [Thermoanaerobaculales bacterium]